MLTSFLAPDLFLVTLLTSGDADDVDQAVIVPDVVLAADGASWLVFFWFPFIVVVGARG